MNMNTKTRKPRTAGTETRAGKKWTPYTNKRLKQMKKQGMTYGQIAESLKRSESSIRQRARIIGLSKTRDHKPRHLVPVTGDRLPTPSGFPEVLKIKHDRLKTLELIEELLNSPKESELIAENIRLKKENADLRSLLKSVQTRVASVFEEVDE